MKTTPGFRFGFPSIERAFYDDVADRFVYIMVSPSGVRIPFRQTTVSNVFETCDSSYVQLTNSGADSQDDPAEDITMTVTGGN